MYLVSINFKAAGIWKSASSEIKPAKAGIKTEIPITSNTMAISETNVANKTPSPR